MAIDRTSKVAFAELQPRATRLVAAAALRRVLEKPPYKVQPVPTDNGYSARYSCPTHWFADGHSFARSCRALGMEHRLTKPAHPWTIFTRDPTLLTLELHSGEV